jgi:dihydrofolate reductase
MKAIIVAYDKNYGIGADNDLLWQRDLPADLQHFKEITNGNAIIMGSKTYQSIGRPLPGRQNIVISRNLEPTDGVHIASNLQSAYDLADHDKDKFIIGGGQIYALAIDTVDRIYATEIDQTFDNATVYFPGIDHKKWRETSREKHLADERNLYNYDFVVYKRI